MAGNEIPKNYGLVGKVSNGYSMGLFPSLPGRKPALFADGRNVSFDELSAQPLNGQFVFFERGEDAPVLGIKSADIGGTPSLFYGSPTKLWRWDASNGLDDRSKAGGYSGTSDNLWSFEKWGTWMLATNGVDTPQIDKGSDFADMTNLPFTTAEIFVRHKQFLVAFNTSNGNFYIEWCSADDLESWTATQANDAGNIPVRDLDSGIIAALPLGQAGLAYYTKSGMRLLSYRTDRFIFGDNELLIGPGACGKHAVARAGREHFGMSSKGLWRSDGANWSYIAHPAIHDFVYEDLNIDYLHKVVAWNDNLQRMICFFYPQAGKTTNTIGVGYRYDKSMTDSNAWTVLGFGRNAADSSGVFDYAVTADRIGNIYQQSVTGAPPPAESEGIMPVAEAGSIELGLGEGGLGELGMGGYYDWS